MNKEAAIERLYKAFNVATTDSSVNIPGLHAVLDELVAAERKQNLDLVQILVEAEREACAKVCEEIANDYDGSPAGTGADNCAEAIRARREK